MEVKVGSLVAAFVQSSVSSVTAAWYLSIRHALDMEPETQETRQPWEHLGSILKFLKDIDIMHVV